MELIYPDASNSKLQPPRDACRLLSLGLQVTLLILVLCKSHVLFNEIDTPMKTAPRINILTVRFQSYLAFKSFDSNVLANSIQWLLVSKVVLMDIMLRPQA